MSVATTTFASASVVDRPYPAALDEVGARVAERLGGAADVAFLFVSSVFADRIGDGPARLRQRLGGASLVGCTGIGVCGTEGESEHRPGVALLAARTPGAGVRAFFVEQAVLAAKDPDVVREAVGLDAAASPSFLLFADPFTFDPDGLLRRLETAYPGAPAAGGLASGATRPGGSRLFLDDAVMSQGAVGLVTTNLRMRCVVSQGCRPVGRRFVVTKLVEGRVAQLSGEPALDALERELASLSESDREAARTNLLIGRAAHEARESFGRGDFLVRNLVGIVPAERSIVVGERLRLGQTLQLQLRDRDTAEEELDVLLRREREEGPASGALLFTCAGRGRPLFGRPDADVASVRRTFGELPLAGFACAGEIGPVTGRNFLHGFTASLAVW